MPGAMGGIVGVIEWEQRDPAGRLVDSGSAWNLVLDQGRSGYAAMLRDDGIWRQGLHDDWLHLGTGTAQVLPTDTALQYFVTAIDISVAIAIEGNYTARRQGVLSATQMTGLITELLACRHSAPLAGMTSFARATLSANHVSGNTLILNWRWALQS